jgi:transposase
VDTKNWGTVARPARTLWKVGFIVATRFYRWQKAEIWNQVLESLQAEADKQGRLDWKVHYVDGSVIRAHQHAAGGKKGAKKKRN